MSFIGHGTLDIFGKIPFDYDFFKNAMSVCVVIHGNISRGEEFDSNVL